MHPFIKKWRVDEPVDGEEMQLMDERQHQKQAEQIPRVFAEAHPWHRTYRIKMQDQHFKRCPDGHATAKGADQAVDILALEEEGFAFLIGGEFGVVFEA